MNNSNENWRSSKKGRQQLTGSGLGSWRNAEEFEELADGGEVTVCSTWIYLAMVTVV